MPFATTPTHESPTDVLREREDQIILEATSILRNRVFTPSDTLSNPKDTARYLQFRLANEERVVFGVVFLDANNRALAFEVLFEGGLTETLVYPRPILERVLHYKAAAVILAHSRPSGSNTPCAEDKRITERLRQGLSYFDVRVLDHLIIGDDPPFSYAEHGLL